MSKPFVKKNEDGDHVPFFRGILTQSLVRSGISFEDAYRIAQEVKDSIKDDAEISSDELKERVGAQIEAELGKEKRENYENKAQLSTDIAVLSDTGKDYFSIGLLTHSLEACAIASDTASNAARCVYEKLKFSGIKEIEQNELQNIIHNCLRTRFSEDSASRYAAWKVFRKSRRPLIILLGGVTGSGKSSISSELSYRLKITGIQSTDLMREIIRSYLTPPVVPTLAYSSFEAWHGLKMTANDNQVKHETKVVMGFLSQMETMLPALEATLSRALKEGHALILEGVHVLPNRLNLAPLASQALIVPVILATMKKQTLQNRLKKRGSENNARTASRYIENIDDIWELQSFLLEEADDTGIPIIKTGNIGDAVNEILEVISNTIVNQYSAKTDTASTPHLN